jgi:hypothetical protein
MYSTVESRFCSNFLSYGTENFLNASRFCLKFFCNMGKKIFLKTPRFYPKFLVLQLNKSGVNLHLNLTNNQTVGFWAPITHRVTKKFITLQTKNKLDPTVVWIFALGDQANFLFKFFLGTLYFHVNQRYIVVFKHLNVTLL